MKTKSKAAKTRAPVATVADGPSDSELRAIENEVQNSALDDEAVEPQAVGSTPVDLAHLGLNQIAYVRRAIVDDQPVWSIYSAMGHPLGAATTLEQAWGAIVQNELQPVYVH
jgi:hypothetical protein